MLLSDLKAYGNGGGFQSRAIMDGNADVDDFDAADKADADLDEFGLDRFPSIDFGANGQPTAAGDVGTSSDPSAYSYSLLNNKMNGAELASISSFDQCAARVSAPLKHLASFDSTYFSPPMESFNSTNNNNNITSSSSSSSSNNNKNSIAPYSDFVSDRVTLLADSSADEMEALNVPTSSSSFNDPQLGKRKSEAISEKSHHDIQMDKRTKPLEGADTTLPDQPASTLRQSLDSEDTEQFIHLLSRNQNVSHIPLYYFSLLSYL